MFIAHKKTQCVQDQNTWPNLHGGGGGQRLGEADHAHVVGVLLQAARALVTAVQTGQTLVLALHAATGVAAHVGLAARQLGVLLQGGGGRRRRRRRTGSLTL